MSSAGAWDYSKLDSPKAYGDTTTYKLGVEFLKWLSVEDWGCGAGYFKSIYPMPCVSVDGSPSRFTDKVVNLQTYRSKTAGLFMRHVLEHNHAWRNILDNALASFTFRFCLIVFTPIESADRVITSGLSAQSGVSMTRAVPDLALDGKELRERLRSVGKVREEFVRTNTAYGGETVFYVEREPIG